MKPNDLIVVAKELVTPVGRGQIAQARLRRGVSTAYYAMFHCLAAVCADSMIGQAGRESEAWIRVNRALEHGRAVKHCQQDDIASLSEGVNDFAGVFCRLQEQRRRADYDLSARFSRANAAQTVADAEWAISALENEPAREKRAFAALVLFQRRRTNPLR